MARASAQGGRGNRRKIDYHEHEATGEELFPDISNVASANECTGLMYRAPRDQAEWEHYQELSSMAIPRKEGKEGKASEARKERKDGQ